MLLLLLLLMMMMMISTPSSVSRLQQTVNENLYQVTEFSLYASFTVHYFFSKVSSFTPVLSIKTALDGLLIFYFEKFSS